MLASVLIIAFSAILFVYWFRYSCVLLLRDRAEQSPAETRFNYASVQNGLKSGLELNPLHRSLERDYRIITYLMEHSADLELEQLEYRLLVLDYKVMQVWYRLTQSAAPQQARQALAEMADVLGFLVARMGQQTGVQQEVLDLTTPRQ